MGGAGASFGEDSVDGAGCGTVGTEACGVEGGCAMMDDGVLF